MKPPQDLDAEQSVLGGLLLDNTRLDDIQHLKPEDFYRNAHQLIYKAIIELINNNQPADIVTVPSKLGADLQKTDGVSYIAQLSTLVPTAANIQHYANIVKEKSYLRQIISISNKANAAAYEGGQAKELIEQITGQFINLQETNGSESKDIKQQVITVLDKIQNQKPGIIGNTTGIPQLDFYTSGLQPEQLIILAARPAMGKTALALNLATHTAIKSKLSVALFNLEMSDQQCLTRAISAESMVPLTKMRTGGLNDDELKRTNYAGEKIYNSKLTIDDTAAATTNEIRVKCRKIKRKKGLDLIVIDYLQLMDGKGENRVQQISQISRDLKKIAKELKCPVIALSQLSRAVEQRENKRPVLSDLRESGSIEADADTVMFLYRDEYYNAESEKKNIAELIIAKQREGPCGTIELYWDRDHQKFAELQKGER